MSSSSLLPIQMPANDRAQMTIRHQKGPKFTRLNKNTKSMKCHKQINDKVLWKFKLKQDGQAIWLNEKIQVELQ